MDEVLGVKYLQSVGMQTHITIPVGKEKER